MCTQSLLHGSARLGYFESIPKKQNIVAVGGHGFHTLHFMFSSMLLVFPVDFEHRWRSGKRGIREPKALSTHAGVTCSTQKVVKSRRPRFFYTRNEKTRKSEQHICSTHALERIVDDLQSAAKKEGGASDFRVWSSEGMAALFVSPLEKEN